ncbi:HAD family hydrolase [Streptomyces sp. NRRL F-5123]|uniref:HAD family hydrolase n=1 Tax=Streptomyces sp. NRRL F-5123 TaxID=1463856 RepID=UPI0004E11159|nr:HAD family phosphatase [Streptomyces sp. NRRL F-5123]
MNEGPAQLPDLVIFDCDGVLVDSERLAIGIDVEMLARLGWPMPQDEAVARFVGRAFADIGADIAAHLGHPLPEGWDTEWRHRLRVALDTHLTAVDGIEVALDALAARGVPMCVASSTGHAGLRRSLGRTGLYDRFAGRIFSAADVPRGKPAPDLFLHAAHTLGVPPARCAVVEDSPYGVTAARAAGMPSFGYAGGLTPAHRLTGPTTTVFTDMRTLPSLLGL